MKHGYAIFGSLWALFGGMPLYSAVTMLYQADFDNGTYMLDKPGTYRLAEDISFNPNSPAQLETDAYHASFLQRSQFVSSGGTYDDAAFGVGFFAAIAVTANGATIDLNGHTIEQSKEHALLQRFFAVIELAEQPFIPKQGPADFGAIIDSASNLTIKNGTIGRSSHHGIHGNANINIEIKNVDFLDYEVAALALNGVQGLKIKNSIGVNRKDVPVLGTFSAARFISLFIDYLFYTNSSTTLTIGENTLTVGEVRQHLIDAINNVHDDLIVQGLPSIDRTAHPDEYALFHNPFGVVDGNSYGFLVNQVGVAVSDFPSQPKAEGVFPSRRVSLKNVHVINQRAFINEVVALNQNKKAVIDPLGAVFQVKNIHPDTGVPITVSSLDDSVAVYTGNILANAQAVVAKAFLNGDFDGSPLDLTRLNMTADVLHWIESGVTLGSFVASSGGYLCNGDSMFHVNKGVIAFKMDAAQDVKLDNTSAYGVENLGAIGSPLAGKYVISHPESTFEGYGGSKARGYTFSGSKNVTVKNSTVAGLKTSAGTAIGFDVLTNSENIRFKNVHVMTVDAGREFKSNGGPTDDPDAIGYHLGPDVSGVILDRYCAHGLEAYNDSVIIMDESGTCEIKTACKEH